jgi:hypothetical protein
VWQLVDTVSHRLHAHSLNTTTTKRAILHDTTHNNTHPLLNEHPP